MCGDFNAPGADDSSIDPQTENVLSRYNLVQHVHQPTHIGRQHQPGNLLDLVITADSTSPLVTSTIVNQTCLEGIWTFSLDMTCSPGHVSPDIFPARKILPPFLHGVGHPPP